MKNLYIKRHWVSKWNKKWIIQWLNFNEWLCQEGVQNTKFFAENIIKWLPINQIKTSELDRALETWLIVNEVLNTIVIPDARLNEFDSWILAWKTHNEIKSENNDYYDIWISRWDLDGIPEAETWNKLQSRVLLFLSDYIDNDNYSDLIISHAWYIRCMVNTILNIDRTTPININHDFLHCFNDIWKNITQEKLHWWHSSEVIKITTKNWQYIFRKKETINIDTFCTINKILKQINTKSNITNKLYQSTNNQDSWLQILEYIEGYHIYWILDGNKKTTLFKMFNELISVLWNIEINENIKLPTLKDKLKWKVEKIWDSHIKILWNQLLNHKYINPTSSDLIVNYDLHRWNILFDDKDNVRLIDFDSLVLSNIEYQIASIVVSFIFEWENNIDELLNNFNYDLSKHKIIYFIKIRIYLWIIFFEEKKEKKWKLDNDSEKIYNRYLELIKKF